MKILDSAQSKELEKRAVESGISYLQLMENAGVSAARFLQEKFNLEKKRVVLLCGKGNNGGDGYVIAHCLSKQGALVAVVLTEGLPVTEISQKMFAELEGLPVSVVNYAEAPEQAEHLLQSADFVVDAIYGTGFHGRVRDPLIPLFQAVKRLTGVPLIAVDMPSGASCDTGAVEGECLKADYTVAFSTLKTGHLLEPARSFCGQVEVLPIGIDPRLIEAQRSTFAVTDWDDAKTVIKPRDPESNKGSYGRLRCVCGSEGMAGAALTSA